MLDLRQGAVDEAMRPETRTLPSCRTRYRAWWRYMIAGDVMGIAGDDPQDI
ncbi:MAG: hypothetical protein P9F19_10685 [Candidatus Contendobacter sp.]|nr:hypothetical protein [Candidatus Contendobacter sp.]MDG4557834.1 hypothetical protein [Candidatus Contendobacter sp.]